MKSKHVDTSFKLAVVGLACLLFAMISMYYVSSPNESALYIGLPLFVSGIFSFWGLKKWIKGRRESKSFRYYFSLIVHLGLALLFLSLILANVMDLAKWWG